MTTHALHHSKATTKPFEFYPTQPEFTRLLLPHIAHFPNHIWECAAGDGAISEILQQIGYQVTSTDIQTGTDFFTVTTALGDAIITNPPFSLASQFITHALNMTPYVVMLLPIYALGGQQRYNTVWSQTPPQKLIIISNRMVVDGKTSHFNHIWSIWDNTGQPTTTTWETF